MKSCGRNGSPRVSKAAHFTIERPRGGGTVGGGRTVISQVDKSIQIPGKGTISINVALTCRCREYLL